ncbi:hypothetical protein POM88_001446 [Heracleum sosnowskyi]|uniref:Uncharacterized protein n=1 Tax=Heracleum sosnowskyi TaxID=360622 RepID=A0AAD8JDQ3_9APIA|nr:hypothetical protein POM88_001446 [Heracleum sosnowskyi]
MLVNGHNEDMELSNSCDKEKVDPAKPTSITWQRKVDSQRIPLSEFKLSALILGREIHGYGMHGLGQKALQTFNRMIESGYEPYGVTFVACLSSYLFGLLYVSEHDQTSFIIYDGRLEGAIAKRTGGDECLLLLLSKDVLMLLQRLLYVGCRGFKLGSKFSTTFKTSRTASFTPQLHQAV